MNISLILFFIISYKHILQNINKDKIVKQLVFITFGILLLMIFYALYLGNEPSLIIRFFLILALIFLAYFINPNKKYVNIFMFFIILQAMLVIGLEATLVMFFDEKSYLFIRHYFLNNNFGDVYTTTGTWWKVQPRGNALLPFAFFISIILYREKTRVIFGGLFLLAIVCAGNFAFILGVLLFSVIYYIYSKRWTLQKIVLNGLVGVLFITVISIPAYSYFAEIVEEKAVSSNPIRIDQTEVLIENMDESISTVLFGQGLGNTVNVITQWRDYSDNIYYELQALYILNQVGILFFAIFILFNMILAKQTMKYGLFLITYGSYAFYSLFNPYFLDTNHIVVIIILLSLRKVFDEKNTLNTRSI